MPLKRRLKDDESSFAPLRKKKVRQPRLTSKGNNRCNAGARNCAPTQYECRIALQLAQTTFVVEETSLLATVATLVGRAISIHPEHRQEMDRLEVKLKWIDAEPKTPQLVGMATTTHQQLADHAAGQSMLFTQFLFLLDELLDGNNAGSWAAVWDNVITSINVVDMATIGHNLFRVLLLANDLMSYAGYVGTVGVGQLSAMVATGRHRAVARVFRLEQPGIPTVAELLSLIYTLSTVAGLDDAGMPGVLRELIAMPPDPTDPHIISVLDQTGMYPLPGQHVTDKGRLFCAVSGIAVHPSFVHLVSGIPMMASLVASVSTDGESTRVEQALQAYVNANLSQRQYHSLAKNKESPVGLMSFDYSAEEIDALVKKTPDNTQLHNSMTGRNLVKVLTGMQQQTGHLLFNIFANLLSIPTGLGPMCVFGVGADGRLHYNAEVLRLILMRSTRDTVGLARDRLLQDTMLQAHDVAVSAAIRTVLPPELELMSGAICPTVVEYNLKDPLAPSAAEKRKPT